MTRTVKPSCSPMERSRVMSPAPRAPKRKSDPTSSTLAWRVSTRIERTKSSGERSLSSWSKVSTRVASTPSDPMSSTFCSRLTRGAGAISGFNSISGCRSKVTTAVTSDCSAAISRSSAMIRRWPEWTPSNLPIVTADGPKSGATASSESKIITTEPPRESIGRRMLGVTTTPCRGWGAPAG